MWMKVKSNINEQDYDRIKNLEAVCQDYEKVAFKFELEYKLSLTNQETNLSEFMCYDHDLLVGYIGICQFNHKTIEVNGMVHPKYRRQGIFTKLFSLVLAEWKKSDAKQMLLVCDKNSLSGHGFIKKTNANYKHTECEMVYDHNDLSVNYPHELSLREATNQDVIEILKQNEIYFNDQFNEKDLFNLEDKKKAGQTYYLAMVDDIIVGKVHTERIDNKAGIYGLGIRPEYRNKGYGKALLCNIIKILKSKSVEEIRLQVEIKNDIASNLYKSTGFKEIYAMEYYELVKE